MRRIFMLLAVSLILPWGVQAQRELLSPRDFDIMLEKWPNAQRLSTGLWTEVLKPSSGTKPVRGDMVSVLYKGFLLDETMFDSAEDPDNPFTFQLDRGKVIKGWEYGLLSMRKGEIRRLIVPYELGYGTRGRAPDIPRQATLVFEVELVEIKKRTFPGE
jgi:FKBP-type peptidyl-prolyl cis-trans isomerase